MRKAGKHAVEAGGKIFYASLEKNPSADAFVKNLSPTALSLETGGNGDEKTASLPWDLPYCDGTLTAKPGDVLLSGKSRITVCLKEKETGAVKLAAVDYRTEEFMKELDKGSITVKLWLEWSE